MVENHFTCQWTYLSFSAWFLESWPFFPSERVSSVDYLFINSKKLPGYFYFSFFIWQAAASSSTWLNMITSNTVDCILIISYLTVISDWKNIGSGRSSRSWLYRSLIILKLKMKFPESIYWIIVKPDFTFFCNKDILCVWSLRNRINFKPFNNHNNYSHKVWRKHFLYTSFHTGENTVIAPN